MSSITYLHVHQSEGVVFDDLAALNRDLEPGVRELLDPENFDDWREPQSTLNGFVAQDPQGGVMLAGNMDHEWTGYATEYVSVYGCVYKGEFEIIANHMTAGKLVIRYETEGWPDEFFVLTPGSVEQPSVKF